MYSRLRLLSVLIVSALALAACSSEAALSPTSTIAPAVPSAYPADGDVALVRIGRPGELPRLVIGGDGWAYFPAVGADTSTSGRTAVVHSPAAVAPPAPPAAYERRRLTAIGVTTVLALAQRLGLLATPGGYADPGVTDMDSIQVTVGDGTSTYVHTAYALGFETESGNRKNLQDFVTAMEDLPSLVGVGAIGATEIYAPHLFSVEDATSFVRSPNEPVWPAGVPVTLGCISLPVDEFPAGTAGIYRADVDGAAARIAVIPHLPGDDCR